MTYHGYFVIYYSKDITDMSFNVPYGFIQTWQYIYRERDDTERRMVLQKCLNSGVEDYFRHYTSLTVQLPKGVWGAFFSSTNWLIKTWSIKTLLSSGLVNCYEAALLLFLISKVYLLLYLFIFRFLSTSPSACYFVLFSLYIPLSLHWFPMAWKTCSLFPRSILMLR